MVSHSETTHAKWRKSRVEQMYATARGVRRWLGQRVVGEVLTRQDNATYISKRIEKIGKSIPDTRSRFGWGAEMHERLKEFREQYRRHPTKGARMYWSIAHDAAVGERVAAEILTSLCGVKLDTPGTHKSPALRYIAAEARRQHEDNPDAPTFATFDIPGAPGSHVAIMTSWTRQRGHVGGNVEMMPLDIYIHAQEPPLES